MLDSNPGAQPWIHHLNYSQPLANITQIWLNLFKNTLLLFSKNFLFLMVNYVHKLLKDFPTKIKFSFTNFQDFLYFFIDLQPTEA